VKKFKNISVEFFKKNFQDSAKIIDIRDKESFISDNIPNSENYNLPLLKNNSYVVNFSGLEKIL